ncbi:MAG: biotin/lipoate A/B protein ligase family protein [Candidatus Bathyarchaeia archaeon]
MPELKWRLLEYSEQGLSKNLALDESILINRKDKVVPDTLRLWQAQKSISIGRNDEVEESIDLSKCKIHGIEIARRISSSGVFYHDSGVLNFSIIVSESSYPIPKEPFNAYRILCDGILKALNRLNLEVTLDQLIQKLYVKSKIISKVAQFYFHDCILFQGFLIINSDLDFIDKVLKNSEKNLTSLKNELKMEQRVNEIKELLIQCFEDSLNIKLKKQSLKDYEKEISKKIYEKKYSSINWNLEGKTPLSFKDVLIELLIANPPTSMCKEVIEVVNKAISGLEDKVEVVIYRRGLGVPPGVRISGGLQKAAKESMIPSIVINGDLSYRKKVPSENELRDIILRNLTK